MSEMTMNAPDTDDRKTFKGRHFLYWIGGFFGVMFAVNGVFLYHAITSFPGEDVEKSYLQGLSYNDTLAARAAQAELGWRAEAGLEDGDIVFRLQDASGQGIAGRPVIAEARHLSDRTRDQSLIVDSVGAGEYRTSAASLDAGTWDIRFRVYEAEGDTIIFEAGKTLTLK